METEIDEGAWRDALEESRWVARLARALVGEEAADDLAQDVRLAALKGAPAGPAPVRRAWLRTVARRIARRSGARDGARRAVEARAASEAANAERADTQIAVQKRLADALARLEPRERGLLVRRYFDDLSAPELAREIGLSPAAVRKRLSRALVHLRAEFARTPDDWRTWRGALVLAAARYRPEPVPALFATLVASLAMKPILAALSAVLVLVLGLALARTGETTNAAPELASERSRGTGLESLEGERSEEIVALETAPAIDAGRSAASPRPLGAPARLHVVDADGAPIASAEGAWVESTRGGLAELAFDAQGSAPLPARFPGWLAVKARGYGSRIVRLEDPESAEAPIVLEDVHVVRGKLVVNGAAPGEPVAFGIWPNAAHPAFDRAGWGPLQRFLETRPKTITANAAGEFAFDLPRGGALQVDFGEVYTPTGQVLDGVASEIWERGRVIVLQLDEVNHVELQLQRMPSARARFLTGPDGPAYGEEVYAYVETGGGAGLFIIHPAEGSGLARVPLDVHPDMRARRRVPPLRSLELASSPRDDVGTIAHLSADEVEGKDDLGTFIVPLPKPLEVEVRSARDGSGEPLPAAWAVATQGRWTTDRRGRCTVELLPGDTLTVGADGHEPRAVAAPETNDAPWVIELEPALDLVLAPLGEGAENQLYVRVTPEDEAAAAKGLISVSSVDGALLAGRTLVTCSVTNRDDGSYYYTSFVLHAPAEDEIRMPALLGAGTLQVELLDAAGTPLETVRIHGAVTDHTTVEFATRPADLARCRLRFEDMGGRPVTHPISVRFGEGNDFLPHTWSVASGGTVHCSLLRTGATRLQVFAGEALPYTDGLPTLSRSVVLEPGTNEFTLRIPVGPAREDQ